MRKIRLNSKYVKIVNWSANFISGIPINHRVKTNPFLAHRRDKNRFMINENENILTGFNEFLQEHETFQLAIIESVHRYFYDKCFSIGEGSRLLKTDEAKYFFDLHQTLHCANPNWRYRLKKKLDRYHAWENTTALQKDSKPKRFLNISLTGKELEINLTDDDKQK